MRFVTVILAGAALAIPASVWAADKTPDVNYDCALFDECGGASASQTGPAPAVRSNGAVRGGFTMNRTPQGTTSTSAPAVAGRKPAPAGMVGKKPVVSPPGKLAAAEAVRAGQLITFVSGSAVLSPSAKLVAQKLATSMLRPDKAGLRYMIEGHTDAVGTRAKNLELSKARAQAVVTYLGTLGVDPRNLDAVGYGFDKPLPNVPKVSAANRRVVAKVITK